MSGEIKILFYVIVGIVYFLSTFYNKEKKKQNQRNINKKPINTTTAEEIFEELKKSILQPPKIKDEKKPLGKTLFEKTKRDPENKVNYKPFKQPEIKKEPKPFLNTEPHFEHHFEPEITDFIETSDKYEFNFDEMDPKKAFIYKEIFRRPQY